MRGGRLKMKKRWSKFLQEYAKDGDATRAYLAAGYKPKTQESARVAGYNLLQKIGRTIEWRETLDEIIPDIDLAKKAKDLLNAESEKVQVTALGIATKCKGWQRDDQIPPTGVTIIVNRTQPDEIEENAPIQVQAPVKPRQITD
jgi:phage terminase small subunit